MAPNLTSEIPGAAKHDDRDLEIWNILDLPEHERVRHVSY